MLTHHDDIFYNIPHNDEDEILRIELPPHAGERYARCPRCDYVYDMTKGAPWPLTSDESSATHNDIKLVFSLERPTINSFNVHWSGKNIPEQAVLKITYRKVTSPSPQWSNETINNPGERGIRTISNLTSNTKYEVSVSCRIGQTTLTCDSRTITTSIEPNTPFDEVPDTWRCPCCMTSKENFTPVVDPNPEMAANNPPKTFLDYLYIHEGSTAFKLDEQSPSHYTMQWDRPLLEIRRLLLNFRRNQLKCNGILPWSTFIMEERKADIDQGIPFKTIEVNATPGVDVKVKSEYFGNTDDFQAFILDAPSSLPKNCEVAYGSTSAAALNKIHESNYTIHTWENYVKDDGTSIIPVKVTNDEFKDLYKIYAQYVKTKDGFDLFFNMQNLFKPPFEYISSVTNQPMPLIPQDCYLYLNSTDKTSGRLTLYAQMKWLVNDITSSMKLIPLVTYDIYNISDDKPKFLLKNAIGCGSSPNTSPNVMLNIEDVSISLNTSDVDETGKLTKPIAVVQTLSTLYASTHEDYSKLDKLTFTLIQNDTALSSKSPVPSLNITSSLSYCFPISSGCATNFRPYTEMSYPDRTYPCRMNKNGGVSIKKEKTGHLVTFTYDDEASFTNEDLYLYWILPKGMDVMEAVAKLGCAFETDAIKCTAVMKNGTSATVSTKRGHVYINSIGKEKYLAKEHGKHYNKHGFVLKKASKIILDSIQFMQGQ